MVGTVGLMVGTVGLIVVAIVYGRWQKQINLVVVGSAKWVWKFLLDSKTCRVAETFCNEVAVLWFVFPLLDRLYDEKKHDDPLLHQAFIVSAIFFVFAVILSHVAGKRED